LFYLNRCYESKNGLAIN